MKKFYFLLMALSFFASVNAQIINFPDANFKAKLLAANSFNSMAHDVFGASIKIDANSNGEIEVNEALVVSKLDISFRSPDTNKIMDISGIEYFTTMKLLVCSGNNLQNITPLSGLTNLKFLDVSDNPGVSFDLSNILNIEWLSCAKNGFTSLDLTKFPNLNTLICSYNMLTSLDLSNLTQLEGLDISHNLFTSLPVLYTSSLKSLRCTDNMLTDFYYVANSNLDNVECGNNMIVNFTLKNATTTVMPTEISFGVNPIENITLENIKHLNNFTLENLNALKSLKLKDLDNLSYFINYNTTPLLNFEGINLPKLSNLSIYSTVLDKVILQNIPSLTQLNFQNKKITSLTLIDLPNLVSFNCSNNLLNNLEVKDLPKLASFSCDNNLLTNLSVQNLPKLITLSCSNNLLPNLNIQNLPLLSMVLCRNNKLTTLSFSNTPNLTEINCPINLLYDINLNTVPSLERLFCNKNKFSSLSVNSSINLKQLDCSDNQLTELNVNNLINLNQLICNNNQLSDLNLNGLKNLSLLRCSNNKITSLNVIGLLNLYEFTCNNNNLTSLDVSSLANLAHLSCSNNQLTSLDLSNLTNIASLNCFNNQIPSLDLGKSPNIYYLYCSSNKLIHLDLNNAAFLDELYCTNNPLLKTILIKNGYEEYALSLSNNPNLEYICADDSQLNRIQDLIAKYGYSNCHVNSYCSFTPGGTFYEITGNTKIDLNTNGCDVADINYSNLKFNFVNGTNSGSLITNKTGNYNFSVQEGIHSITPVFENPNYFSASPTSTTIIFPIQASPFTQDFCITPNGTHSDVEVTVFPVEAARPGFDAKYKIVYKNKGNQIENGSVNLTFDDAKMDYVSSSPVFYTQSTNQLTWNYSNLKPFETRTIDVVLNINSPMETPAVNGGDVLSYTATILSGNTDELPNDNTFTLNQTVMNSFDPNDITCLEGVSVSTAKIGDYVHYIIRFENTGSANATNIVVKNVVDATKYDVNSIVPIIGSHDYYTRINGNNVEFIFENINLPFDDATNDGYVSFKIKTKSTLVAGDTFSKNANIYFDYNFPILTNTATTTITALSKQDFEFKNYFSLFPNPVSNTLNIEAKNTIEISSVNIYNALGQLVLVVPNAQNTKSVDVSSLSSGNYFIKVNSNKGTSNTKFIKQ